MAMELATQGIEVGIFTNRIDEMRAFYGERLRLPFETMLPLGPGMNQYRYAMLGSILKLNHATDPLPPRRPGGYKKLTISDPRTPMPFQLGDPDGNEVSLVPAGQRGIKQIEIQLAVTDEGHFARFYGEVVGAEKLDANRFRIGASIIAFAKDPAAARAEKAGLMHVMEVINTMRAVGIRYITIPVRNCEIEYRRLIATGAWEGSAPFALGDIAKIAFIRDPDGNFIEIAQLAPPKF
jgi:predicted enzyme related to lactoylglutathione lyase